MAGFEARRGASAGEVRRAEIDEFEQVREPEPPRPLRSVFLVPAGS